MNPFGDVRKQRADLSPLMKAKISTSGVVKACPFGCKDHDYDDQGYCHHVVGFTIPGNDKMMEPFYGPGRSGHRTVYGNKVCPVPEGAELMKITVSSRVYMKNAEKFPDPVPAIQEPAPKSLTDLMAESSAKVGKKVA